MQDRMYIIMKIFAHFMRYPPIRPKLDMMSEVNPKCIDCKFFKNYITLPQAGVEPAFFRLEVGRDIHFATKVKVLCIKILYILVNQVFK